MDRGQQLVQVVSCVLCKLVAGNDAHGEQQPLTKFHALRAPAITIPEYMARVLKYSGCSSECFLLSLVYIDRLIQRSGILLTSLNIHRIIITSVMLAAKFFDDQYFNNAFYAKVGGVPPLEMNSLELEFLFSINFSLHVPADLYEKYNQELYNHVARPTMPCGCPEAFRLAGTMFTIPPIPKRLPAPGEPGMGYRPEVPGWYPATEVFTDEFPLVRSGAAVAAAEAGSGGGGASGAHSDSKHRDEDVMGEDEDGSGDFDDSDDDEDDSRGAMA